MHGPHENHVKPNYEKMGHSKRPLAFSLVLLTTITLLFVWYSTPPVRYSKKQIDCYIEPGNLIPELTDNEPKVGEGIFFHETSCSSLTGDFPLNARQACAVESAAVAHPESDVFVLFVSPVAVQVSETKNKAMQALLTYPNIRPRHIDFRTYIGSTPMKDLFIPLQHSGWPVSHASDIMRYATLYKFGGVYLDMDIIIIKHLPDYSNYVGAESPWSLGAGAISFGSDKVGLDMASSCANEIARHFRPSDWGYNGPGVITRVLAKRCNMKRTIQLWGKDCNGFRIFSPSAFYAIPYKRHKDFFTPGLDVQKNLSNSYLVHYWNRFSSKISVEEASPFYAYAKEFCPKVFEAVKGKF